MYFKDIVFLFILLVSEMMKIGFHLLKKLAFVTNQFLAQDAFGKHPRAEENLLKYTAIRE